jgi:glutamyl-tRNA synthetase
MARSPATTAASICFASKTPTAPVRPSPAIEAIFDGLRWLGLDGDEPRTVPVRPSERHAEVAQDAARFRSRLSLLPDARRAGRAPRAGPGRASPLPHRQRMARCRSGHGALRRPSVVRIKAPREGETVIEDLVQGSVTVSNAEIDDFVLLRSDGTPTYMLAVVVDDHDMGVTTSSAATTISTTPSASFDHPRHGLGTYPSMPTCR